MRHNLLVGFFYVTYLLLLASWMARNGYHL